MTEGFKITVTATGALEIVITDPVIAERVISNMHKSNSRKVKAVREAIMAALTPAAAQPEPMIDTPESINDMIAGLEGLLAQE